MGALDPNSLVQQVLKATWSLQEAAHLVHGVNPVKDTVEISETSSHSVSRTYFWLRKEFIKGRLTQVGGDAASPRFSPGTLMRHLNDKGRFVSPEIRQMYDAAHGQWGPKGLVAEAKGHYLRAAELFWKDDPDMPSARVAEVLVNLPSEFSKNYLPRFAVSTIRKWLRGKGPGKPGRPRSGGKKSVEPDLGKIAKKVGEN